MFKKLLQRKTLLVALLVMTGAGNVWADTYTKVASDPSDWSGTYVIVADGSNVIFTGKSENNNYGGYTSVTISNNSVVGDFTDYEVEVEKSGDYYVIKHVKSGNYLGWEGGNSLHFSTFVPSANAYKWSLSTSSILNASDQSRKLQYNSSSPRFACYTSSQKVAYLYKKDTSSSAVATTTTIDDTDITNTDVNTNTAAGSLSATVKDNNDTEINSATVTWSGNNDDVATIEPSTGAVTLVGAGEVTFTASYAGETGVYQASYATYEMTVTSSAPYVQSTYVTINMDYSWLGSKNGNNLSSAQLPVVKEQDIVKVTITDGTSTRPRGDDGYIRVYNGSTIIFEAPTEYTISKIVFTTGGNNTWNMPSVDSGTLSDKTWTGDASSVTFTLSGSCFISSVAITLSPSQPDERATTIVTIDASGITNTNVYNGTVAGQLVAAVKAGETTLDGASVTWSGDNDDVATIDSDGKVSLVAAGNVTFTATYAGDENNYKDSSAEYKLTVVNEDPNQPGASAENPYNVAQAIEATPATGTSDNVYIRGIVSAFHSTSIVGDGQNFRYYISDDGTTNDKLLVYKGKGLNNVAFSNANDLQIGDEVVIYGGLTTYNSTKEVAANNYIVILNRKKTAELTLSETVLSVYEGAEDEEVTFSTVDGYKGVITAESDNTGVASVTLNENSMTVSFGSVGTATITVTAPAIADYEAQQKTIAVTVSEAPTINLNRTLVFTYSDCGIVGGGYANNNNRTLLYGTYDGDNTTTGFDGFKLTEVQLMNQAIQVKNTTGKIIFPKVLSQFGFDVKVKKKQGDCTILIDDVNTTSTNNKSAQMILSGSSTLQIESITLTPKAAPVTVNVGTTKYATLYSDANLVVPEGITVYAVGVNDNANALVVTEVAVEEFTTIEGGQGYMLKADAAGSYTFTATSNDADMEDATGNLLKGTMTEKTITADGHQLYKLAYGENGIGFYLDSNDGKTLNNGANKAYLDVPTTLGIRGFALSDAITAIEAIEMKNSVAEGLYDLQGRRVHDVQKGIYVVNGKKLFVK